MFDGRKINLLFKSEQCLVPIPKYMTKPVDWIAGVLWFMMGLLMIIVGGIGYDDDEGTYRESDSHDDDTVIQPVVSLFLISIGAIMVLQVFLQSTRTTHQGPKALAVVLGTVSIGAAVWVLISLKSVSLVYIPFALLYTFLLVQFTASLVLLCLVSVLYISNHDSPNGFPTALKGVTVQL